MGATMVKLADQWRTVNELLAVAWLQLRRRERTTVPERIMLPLLQATDHPIQAEEFLLSRMALNKLIITTVAGEPPNRVNLLIQLGIQPIARGVIVVIVIMTALPAGIVTTEAQVPIPIAPLPEAVLSKVVEQPGVVHQRVQVQAAAQEAEINQNISGV